MVDDDWIMNKSNCCWHFFLCNIHVCGGCLFYNLVYAYVFNQEFFAVQIELFLEDYATFVMQYSLDYLLLTTLILSRDVLNF